MARRGHSSRIHPTLERAPGRNDNWVESTGGLPSYIDRIARHIHYDRPGYTISHSIAAAVNRVKRWSRGGGNVTPATRAKAAAALASWNAKRARSKARTAARGRGRGRRRARSVNLAVPHCAISSAPGRHGFTAPWRHHYPTWQVSELPESTVWELAISSHGWRPNNPITALQWRKGAWTPPGGSPIKAATIRSRLGAKTNKDAIRILRSDPAAMDKVLDRPGKSQVRTSPRTRTASTRAAWDSTTVRRKGTIKRVSDIRRSDVVETPGGSLAVWGRTRPTTRTGADGTGRRDVLEVTAFRTKTTTAGDKANRRKFAPDNGEPIRFFVEPDEQLNVVGVVDTGNNPNTFADPAQRLRGPRTAGRGGDGPTPPASTTTRPPSGPSEGSPPATRPPRRRTPTRRRADANSPVAPRRQGAAREITIGKPPPEGAQVVASRSVSRAENEATRARMREAQRGTVVQKATKKSPFEVTRRNGRFHTRDTRDGSMSRPMTKREALARAQDENQRAARPSRGPAQDLSDGFSVQKQRNGSWSLIRDGKAIKEYKTKREALQRHRDAVEFERAHPEYARGGAPPVAPRGQGATAPQTGQAPREEALAKAKADPGRQPPRAGYAFLTRDLGELPNGRKRAQIIDSEGGVWDLEIEQRTHTSARRGALGSTSTEGVVWARGPGNKNGAARFTTPGNNGPTLASVRGLLDDLRSGKRRSVRVGRTPDEAAKIRKQDTARAAKAEKFSGARGEALAKARKASRENDNTLVVAPDNTSAKRDGQVMDIELVGSNGQLYQVWADQDANLYTVTDEQGRTTAGSFAKTLPMGTIARRIQGTDDLGPGLAQAATTPASNTRAAKRRAAVANMTPAQREAHVSHLERRAEAAKGGRYGGGGSPKERARMQRMAKEARTIGAQNTAAAAGASAPGAAPRRQSATAPRRTATPATATRQRAASQRTSAQPSGAPEGALFGLTPDQKAAQKQRVAEAIESFASGTPAGAAQKLLSGKPVTRRIKDEDGGTMELTVRREADGTGWSYATKGPDTEAPTRGRGLSLTGAVEGARASYQDIYDRPMPAPKRPKQSTTDGAAAPRRQSATAPAAPAEPARDTRSYQEVAQAEFDAERAASEQRASERLVRLRQSLANAEKSQAQYLRRHPVASTRSLTVQRRVAEHQQQVEQVRRQLADAEQTESGTPPTQLTFNNARDRANKAGKDYMVYRAKVGPEPTARQSAELDKRRKAATDAHREFLSAQHRRGEGEQAKARIEAARPFRVYGADGTWQGFDTEEEADRHASSAGFTGSTVQVTTRSGQVRRSFFASREATEGELTRAQVWQRYEADRNPRVDRLNDAGSLRQDAASYRERARITSEPEGRAALERLAQRAEQRIPEVERATAERERSRREAEERAAREQAPQRARERYLVQTYGLKNESFRNANVPVTGIGSLGETAWLRLSEGDHAGAVQVLREGAERLRTDPGLSGAAGSDWGFAERVEKVADTVERKLSRPKKDAGAGLAPVGPVTRGPDGTASRQAFDHTGREWTITFDEQGGTLSAASGGMSGQATFKPGDSRGAMQAAQRMIAGMVAPPAELAPVRARSGGRTPGAAAPGRQGATAPDLGQMSPDELRARRRDLNAQAAKLQKKWDASFRRNGSENVSDRVEANRDKMRAQAAQINRDRRDNDNALFEALHPDEKYEGGVRFKSDLRPGEVEAWDIEVDGPGGIPFRYSRDQHGGATMSRDGISVRVGGSSELNVDNIPAGTLSRRLQTTVDRLRALRTRTTTDSRGYTLNHYASADDLATVLEQTRPYAYVYRNTQGEWISSGSPPQQGQHLRYLSDRWEFYEHPGDRSPTSVRNTDRQALRVLGRGRDSVELSDTGVVDGAYTRRTVRADLTGKRRITPGGAVEVQVIYANGNTRWVPLSVVADQVRE